MALSMNIKIIDNQIDVDNAYLKIVSILVTTLGESKICLINLAAYKNKESADNETQPLMQYQSEFVPVFGEGSTDIKRQGYEYLKTLPEYANSVDC